MRAEVTSAGGPTICGVAAISLQQLSRVMQVTRPENATARKWVLTYNNPPSGDMFYAVMLGHEMCGKIKYAKWQLELAPTTGTPHMQMWVIVPKPIRHTGIRSLFPGCHVERQLGSDAEAEEYVQDPAKRAPGPDSGPWEVGDRKSVGQGARTDVNAVSAAVQRGESLEDIAAAYPSTYIRMYRGIEALKNIGVKDRTEPPKVFGFIGGAGIGKTKAAVDYAEARDLTYWIHPGGGKWFDGYQQQKVVILDELDKWCEEFGYGKCLRLLDRYKMSVEVKGSSKVFNSPVIIFTATKRPEQWFPDPGTGAPPKEQLERRINNCFTRDSPDEDWREIPLFRPVKLEKRQAPLIVIDDEEPQITASMTESQELRAVENWNELICGQQDLYYISD